MISFRCLIAAIVFGILLTATLARAAGELQIVKATWSPNGGKASDVTKIIAGLVKDNRLDWQIDPATLGTPGKKGRLMLTFKLDGALSTKLYKSGDQIWLSTTSKADWEMLKTIEELRKVQPEGLLIIKAEYYIGNTAIDVKDLIAAMIVKDSLTVPVSYEAFGQERRGDRLVVVYHDGKELKKVEAGETQTLQIGEYKRAIVARNGGLVDLHEKLAEMRKEKPTGLIVLDARFGNGDWIDVTEVARSVVIGDSLTLPVTGEVFGKWAGHNVDLELYYAVGDKLEFIKQHEGTILQIGDDLTSISGLKGELVSLVDRAAERRKQYPTGLLVVDARFGERDVTDVLQSWASGDSLTALGSETTDPKEHRRNEKLTVVYQQGDKFMRVVKTYDEPLQIGPRRTTIPKRTEYGMLNLDKLVEERRKKHPAGLLIVDAKFGRGDGWMDVTDRVQDKVKRNTLDITPSVDEWGTPGRGGENSLITTYLVGKRCVSLQTFQGFRQQINENTIVLVDEGGLPLDDKAKVELLRGRYGDGLLILEATYGYGEWQLDVREFLQEHVKENQLRIMIGRDWPTIRGGNNQFRMKYWDGSEIKTIEQRPESELDVRGVDTFALPGIKEPPTHASVGQSLSHAFGVAGKYTLKTGPQGATLSTTGVLKWTPKPDQVGIQRFEYTITVKDKSVARVASIEVVSAAVAKQVGGDPAKPGAIDPQKLSQLMSLDLGAGPATYTIGVPGESALVLGEKQLLVLNKDGTTVKKRFDLTQTYTQIAEREKYYVALAQNPASMVLLDKTTLKPIRTIKLLYRSTPDLALHPHLPLSYVATEQAVEDEARFKVVVVNETTGDVREPENAVGRFLAVSPDGKHLYTGYKDLYRKGTRLFMNPDGRIWDTPEYGNIDVLLVYDIQRGGDLKLRAHKDKPGTNGSGLRLSPDGRRLSYLSFTGYPVGSGAIPAWDPTDLEKKPVGYDCKPRAGATRMVFHPMLPLTLVPSEAGCLIFDRENGDEQKDRVTMSDSLGDAKVEDAQFSPDGLSVILQIRQAGTAYLRKLPLRLSDAERNTVDRGAPKVAPPAPPAPEKASSTEPRV